MIRLARAVVVAIAAAALATPAAAVDITFGWGHPAPQGNPVFGLAFLDALNGCAVCGGGTVLTTADGGEHWQTRHGLREVADELYDLVATPAGTYLAVGTGVHRSTDGGATWAAIAAPAADDLRDLGLIPGGGVSAAGAGGVVLVSFDDGLSWSEVGPGVGTVTHHLWRSASEGYAVGKDVAHRTTDGGATWVQFIPFEFFGYNEVYFTTADDGYVVEDFATWTTTDGGETWAEQFAPTPPLYRYRTLALTPQHWLTVCNGEGQELWETLDGGSTWTEHLFRRSTGFPCLTQAPGGRVFFGSDTGDLFWTDDFGQTIGNAATNLCDAALGAYIVSFATRGDGVLFAANQPSTGSDVESWLRSDDGGTTWTVPAAAPGLRWVNAAAFLGVDRGVAVSYGDVRTTADGGESWQPATLPGSYRGWRIALPAADRYFIAADEVGGGGALLRSTDGGNTWVPVGGGLPPSGVSYTDVGFPSTLLGYAAGRTIGGSPVLYATTDGGLTWQPRLVSGLPVPITVMTWLDPQVGVASARSADLSGIFRTVDGGRNWTQVLTASIKALAFHTDGRGVATAFSGQTFYVTADGGQTWEPALAPLNGPFPAQFDGPTLAAAVADGWVLGARGNRILVARDLTATPVVEDPGDESAAGVRACRVTQVYPNPFNPRTSLRYALAAAGPVRLTIHDLRGRRVRNLVDGSRAAGEHAAFWDGTDDAGRGVAGGVYVYRLESGGGVDSGKLSLLK
ncbi:MAG: YCF48-related protein [Candidatus Krumholzibacteriia bacterium]